MMTMLSFLEGGQTTHLTGVDDTCGIIRDKSGMHDLPLALRLMCSERVTSDSLSFAPPALRWLAKTNSRRCHNTGQDVSSA